MQIFIVTFFWNVRRCIAYYECKPRKSLVPTCGNGDYFLPPYVELNRCQGGLNNPHMNHCQAKKTEMIDTKVMDFGGVQRIVKLENHLECEEVCVCGDCGRRKAKPVCEQGFIWDESRCKCICTCAFNNNIKSKDESNKASDTHNITATQLILIMIGEFLTICIIILTVRKAVEHHKRTKHSKIINGENTISYNALKDNGVHL